jgi:hypothetical protein
MVGSNQLIEDMTQHERLSLRQTHCGSFERALIEAYFKADSANKERLEKAFKHTMFDLR